MYIYIYIQYAYRRNQIHFPIGAMQGVPFLALAEGPDIEFLRKNSFCMDPSPLVAAALCSGCELAS